MKRMIFIVQCIYSLALTYMKVKHENCETELYTVLRYTFYVSKTRFSYQLPRVVWGVLLCPKLGLHNLLVRFSNFFILLPYSIYEIVE